MRRSKPIAIVAGAAMFALAACGGSGSTNGDSGSDKADGEFRKAETEIPKDPEAQGPAAEVDGAAEGGTITVLLPSDPGPDDLDPTGGWSVTGNSIQQALVNRSLTQYRRDADGTMILVPDLATDLGQPNEDFTEWTFTIRDDATWEDGKPVTAEEVAWGISRSMDSETFPSGPGTEYSVNYFSNKNDYQGPYTDKGKDWEGVSFDKAANSVTIKMAKPFPDMDYWGAFMAMGPAPLGKASQPPAYGKDPLATGPYKLAPGGFRPGQSLTLVKNEQWVPESDPARHQYADKWVFKFNQDQAKTDELMLSDNAESQTAVSLALGSDNYTDAKSELGDRLVQQSSQCTSTITPDYTKITDINVRKAIAYAYPYEAIWSAGGEVPGVTRVPANSVMPPGMSGKKEYFVDGEQITYNPEKAKELLKEAGYEPGEFKITMIYYEADSLAKASQEQLVTGMKEAGIEVKGIPVQESPYNVWLDPDNKINKTLNLRGVNWCSDWPSGLTFIPALLRGGATYNTAFFDEKEVNDRMDEIPTLPLEEQPGAWGDLDEQIAKDYFPIIPTAFRNDLFVFGSKIGNPTGDGSMGTPNYKDLFVMQ